MATDKSVSIKLRPMNKKVIVFGIKGTSALLMHKWSEKGKKMLRMTATERRKVPKTGRDSVTEAREGAHVCEDGRYGIPLNAIKSALINAAHKDIGLEKVRVRKSLFILEHPGMPSRLIPLECGESAIREDVVRVNGTQTDLRYRTEIPAGWKCQFSVEVDYDAVNENDLANLINRAGFGVGLLEWRPECSGEFGRFEIDPDFQIIIKNLDGTEYRPAVTKKT